MRVAMVILEYAPITGGAQQQLAQVAPRLRERGIEVHVLTRRVGDLPAREVIDGVPVHRLPAPGPRAAASLAFTAAGLARLASLQPQVIHAYSLFSPATMALLARAATGVPVVAKVLRGGVRGDLDRLGARPLARVRIGRLARHVDRFVTISAEIDAELARAGVPSERRVAIPNGVDGERFRPPLPGEQRAVRRRLGLEEDAPTAIYCGRLVPEKGVARLLEVWRGVREQHARSQLLIVGGGPEEEGLRRIAGAGVHFVGERSDVAEVLRAADLFVLPSTTEGLSNALLEAMATGLPVVATGVGATFEVVEDEAVGAIVPTGDEGALRGALVGLLRAPDRARLGARARERVMAGYSLESVVERLSELYRALAASPRAAATVRHGSSPRPRRSDA